MQQSSLFLLVVGFLSWNNAQLSVEEFQGAVCYRSGAICLPEWFQVHIGMNLSVDVHSLELMLMPKMVSEDHLARLGDQPPDCRGQKDVIECVKQAIERHCVTKDIYSNTVESYLQRYIQLCEHVACLVSATSCLNNLETLKDRCQSKPCLVESMDLCSSIKSEIVHELMTLMKSEILACQQKDCFEYLSSITTGSCNLLHSDDTEELLQKDLSVEEVCLAVPQMVHCALHTPDVCLSLLDSLLDRLGLNILLMSEVKELLHDSSNRNFADVYFNVFFQTEACKGCLEGIFSCMPDFTLKDPFRICNSIERVQSCVDHNVPMCSHLFPTSFRPAFEQVMPDLLTFAKWICGVVYSDGTSCYVKSLECLGLQSVNRSRLVGGLGDLLDLFMSLEPGSMNEISTALCIEKDARRPCLKAVHSQYCEKSDRLDMMQQFLVLDQVMGLFCWMLNGDYSFESLATLSWFSDIDLTKAWQEVDDDVYITAGLEGYSVHLEVTLEAEWDDMYSNLQYPGTALFKDNLEDILNRILAGRPNFMNSIVQAFSKGSLIADVMLVNMKPLTPHNKVELVRFLLEQITLADYMIPVGADHYAVQQITVITDGHTQPVPVLRDRNPCLLYDIFTVCGHGVCLTEDSPPTCRCEYGYGGEFCTESVDKDMTIRHLVFWVVLVTLLVAVPVIIITVFCLKYKQRLEENQASKHARESELIALEPAELGDSLVMRPEPVYQQVLYIRCTEDLHNPSNINCTAVYDARTTTK